MSTNHSQIISKLPIVCILSGVAIGLLASIGLGSALLPSSGFKKKPKLKLQYFNLKGKAECIRLVCSYANIPLEDYRFKSRDEFDELKKSGILTFGQVPALFVNDGEAVICQSNAIMRYLGKLTGTYPKCPQKAALVDSIMDQENDLFMGLSVSRYAERFGYSSLKPDQIKEIRKELNDKVLPAHLANFEKLLSKSKSGYVADTEEPSIADFVLVPRLEWLVGGDNDGISKDLYKNFPCIQKLIKLFNSNARIQAYHLLASKS